MPSGVRTSLRAPRWAIAAWIGASVLPMVAWLLGTTTLTALEALAERIERRNPSCRIDL